MTLLWGISLLRFILNGDSNKTKTFRVNPAGLEVEWVFNWLTSRFSLNQCSCSGSVYFYLFFYYYLINVIYLGATLAAWAEGFEVCRLWVQLPRLETKAASSAPLPCFDHPSCQLSCCHQQEGLNDVEESARGILCRRSGSATCRASYCLSHSEHQQRGPPSGCPAAAEASWLLKRNVWVDRNESAEQGRPPPTWFPGYLRQEEK